MFCKNCGKEIDDSAYVCVHCGVKVERAQTHVEVKQRNNVAFGLGIAGFALSILSLWLAMYYCVASIVAIVLSAVSMNMAKKNDDKHGLATAGLIIGIVSTAIWLIVLIFAASIIFAALY